MRCRSERERVEREVSGTGAVLRVFPRVGAALEAVALVRCADVGVAGEISVSAGLIGRITRMLQEEREVKGESMLDGVLRDPRLHVPMMGTELEFKTWVNR